MAATLRLSGEIVMHFCDNDFGYIHVGDIPLAEYARRQLAAGDPNAHVVRLGDGVVTISIKESPRYQSLPGQLHMW